jgi:hypothetical protein
MTKISTSLLIACLWASVPAFARNATFVDHEQGVTQARVDIADARCVLADLDAQCHSSVK